MAENSQILAIEKSKNIAQKFKELGFCVEDFVTYFLGLTTRLINDISGSGEK